MGLLDDTILACDLGGTRLRVAVIALDGSILWRKATQTPREDPDALVRLMREGLGAADAVRGAVVGVPGPVDYRRSAALRLPNLPRWNKRLDAAGLTNDLGLRTLVANDADLAALGEHRFGAGKGVDDMLYMTSSTGVGAGVIVGGRLLRAGISLAEVGHTIIDRATYDTVESLGSGTALGRRAGEDAAAVGAKASAGDPEARDHFSVVATDFAIGVYNAVHCFSPEAVVIGGGMSQSGELLLGPVREMLKRCGSRCPASRAKVLRAAGGDDVGLKGAVAFWQESLRSA